MTTRAIGDIRRDAQTVSDAVRLDQVYLTSLSFEVDASFSESHYTVETSLRVKGERESAGVIIVSARHESVARMDGMPSDGVISWSAIVAHEARFDVLGDVEELTDDQLMAFAIDVATDILHPYARELTQSITGRSPFPAFTLGRTKSIWEKDPADVVQIEPIDSK